MSFELNISPKDRVAGRFIGAVRKALLKAALEEKQRSGVSQQTVATKLGVNRSVINRLLRGDANLTLRSVAEIAWALGRKPKFELASENIPKFSNGFGSPDITGQACVPVFIGNQTIVSLPRSSFSTERQGDFVSFQVNM